MSSGVGRFSGQWVAVLWLACGLLACASGVAHPSEVPPPADLSQGWEFRWAEQGEQPLLVASERPGAPAWSAYTPGVPPPERDGRRLAWFHVRLPHGNWPDPAVFLGSVDTDFELYVDGQLLARHGQMGEPLPAQSPGTPWHLVRLPPDFTGRVLALRVHSPHPLDLGPSGRLAVGSRSDLVQALVTSDLDLLLIGLLCLCLGGMALLPGLRSHEERPLLWFGVYAATRGLVLLALSDVRLLLWDAPGAWYHLMWVGRTAGPVALCGLASALFGGERRWLDWLWRGALAAGLAMQAVALVDFWPVYGALWRGMYVLGPILLVATFAVAVREAWRGTSTARLFLFGLGGYMLTALHDVLVALHWLKPGARWEGWGLLFLVSVLGVVAQGRLWRVLTAVRAHAAELEAKNARLEEAERALQAAVRTREEFLSVASHELKTPLTSLLLRVQRLVRQVRHQEAPAREGLLADLESVRRQAVRLDRLAQDLLDVTRMTSGPPSLELVHVDLAALVREAVNRAREDAERSNSPLTLTAPDALMVLVDPLRMEQVVTNLLSNALKYGAGKPVHLVLELRDETARLTVEDQGVGIAPEAQARIFERFERAASVRHYPGLGLGLWIAREIIGALGGSIQVESTPGRGSRFVVELPVLLTPAMAQARAG